MRMMYAIFSCIGSSLWMHTKHIWDNRHSHWSKILIFTLSIAPLILFQDRRAFSAIRSWSNLKFKSPFSSLARLNNAGWYPGSIKWSSNNVLENSTESKKEHGVCVPTSWLVDRRKFHEVCIQYWDSTHHSILLHFATNECNDQEDIAPVPSFLSRSQNMAWNSLPMYHLPKSWFHSYQVVDLFDQATFSSLAVHCLSNHRTWYQRVHLLLMAHSYEGQYLNQSQLL